MNVNQSSNLPQSNSIIGLAGHVDHGKTTLIKALTGITTARPHEQKLGMTQDLGFAHLEDGQGNMIGIVDVPGHERYLRNMVAGVWHINVLLLVISAEEGCMPMTLTHTQIATAMGVERIVVCINKCDKVTKDQLEEVEEAALETIMDISGIVPEIVCVSAATGENIEQLKSILIKESRLAATPIENTDNPNSPVVYVDRVFVVNGIGTIVTGTLTQGALKVGDKLHCEPAKVTGQIRSIQTYHQQVEEVQPTSRVAINVKGLTRKQVKRGDLLFGHDAPVTLQQQCIIRVKTLGNDKTTSTLKNKRIEVATGSWHGIARYIPLPDKQLARLVFDAPIPLYFGQRILLIPKGDKGCVTVGEMIWDQTIPKHQKRDIYERLEELPNDLSNEAQLNMLLSLQGYYKKELACSKLSDYNLVIDDYVVSKEWFENTKQQILSSLDENRSISSSELSYSLKIKKDICSSVLQCLKKEQKIHLNMGLWHIGDGNSEDDLPEPARKILQHARDMGRDGLELNKVELGKDKKWLRQLTHSKFITAIDENIYFDMGVYLDLVKTIIGDKGAKDTTSIQEIKQLTNLSRKYAIPLANRMEKDGWMRREDEVRVILKPWACN